MQGDRVITKFGKRKYNELIAEIVEVKGKKATVKFLTGEAGVQDSKKVFEFDKLKRIDEGPWSVSHEP